MAPIRPLVLMNWIVQLGIIALLASGCGRKQDSGTSFGNPPREQLQNARELEAAFQGAPVELKSNIDIAAEALRDNDLERASAALVTIQQQKTPLTFDQGLVVRKSMRDLQRHLAAAAARDDPRAVRAIELLKRTQVR